MSTFIFMAFAQSVSQKKNLPIFDEWTTADGDYVMAAPEQRLH